MPAPSSDLRHTWTRCSPAGLSRDRENKRKTLQGDFLAGLFDVNFSTYLKIIQQGFILILCGKTGVTKVTIGVAPLLKPPVVEQTKLLGNDERHDASLQAHPEHEQSAHTPIPILEGVDALKTHMEIQHIIQLGFLYRLVISHQLLHLPVHILGQGSFHATHLVRELLIVAHTEPGLFTVRSIGFQDDMQLPDVCLGNALSGMTYDVIYAAEVIHRLHDIIYASVLGGSAQCVRFKDKARLLPGEATSLHVVRVVGQVYLCAVVDAPFQPTFHFLPEPFQQGGGLRFLPLGKLRIHWNVPRFPSEESPWDFSRSTIVSGGALTDAIFLGELNSGDVFHISASFFDVSAPKGNDFCRYRQVLSDFLYHMGTNPSW